MVKREQEISPAPSEYGSTASSPASADVKPTAKRTKKTLSPTKTKTSPKKTPQPRAEGVISNEMKTEMMIAAMEMAHKGLPFDAFAAEVSPFSSAKILAEHS